MTHFIFTGDKNTDGDLVTYNDRICYHAPFNTDFPFSVPAQEFSAFVERCKEDFVYITSEGEYQIKAVCGKATAIFNVLVEDELGGLLSELEDQVFSEDADWKDLPPDFGKGLSLCQFCIGGDEQQTSLTNLYVHKNYMMGSDGDRASSFIMDGLLDPEDDSIYLMIKNKSVKEVAKFNPSSYLLGGNWVHFSDENDAVLSVRNVLGSYPSESVLELTESVRGKPITLPVSDLTEAIDLTEFMAESKLKSERNIEVRITTTKLSCYGKKDKGEASCEVDYESGLKEGEKVAFFINPDFLKEIISAVSTITVDKKVRKALFRTGKKFNHVIHLRSTLIKED